MGAFKPLLPFGDKTVIENCISYLLEGGAEMLVVVTGYRAHEMRERLAGLPIHFAFNPDEASEMSTSIARGVEQIPHKAEAVLVALCDQPAIPPEVIRLMIGEWRSTGARLLLPEYQGRGGHPVLLDLYYREQLLNLDPRRGLRALFDAHRDEVRRVAVTSPYIARDIDTWDDYQALYLEIFGVAPPEKPLQA